MYAINLRSYEHLSLFETKDELIRLASTSGQTTTHALMHHAAKRFGFQPDSFVYELVDAITGHNYPVADRMLVHAEQVVHEYLMQAICGSPRPPGRQQSATSSARSRPIACCVQGIRSRWSPRSSRPCWRDRARGLRPRAGLCRCARKRTVSSSLTPNLRSWRIQGQGILPCQPRKSNLGCAQPCGGVGHITRNWIVLALREESDAVAKGGPIDAR
jgi:hypothetical protein